MFLVSGSCISGDRGRGIRGFRVHGRSLGEPHLQTGLLRDDGTRRSSAGDLLDPSQISLRDVLEIFFAIHDPTTLNSQGNDHGTQYRSVIFYHSPGQRAAAEEIIEELTRENAYGRPVVTALEPATAFYSAEGYHQDYFANNSNQPYCAYVVAPKVQKFRAKFAEHRKA